MLNIEQIREQSQGITISFIAAKTGLHYHTVRHALQEGTNPSYETVKALSDFHEERAARLK